MNDLEEATQAELRQRVIELEAALTRSNADLTALSEERNVLRLMVDNIPDYIYAKDSQSRFIMCNLNTATASGVPHSEDMIGKTDFDFFPAEQAAGFFQDEQAIMQTGHPLIHQEEYVTNQATGQDKWIDTIKTPLYDNSGQIIGVVGIGHDITERKQEQAVLQETQAELCALYNATSHLFQADNLLSLGEQIVQAVLQEFGQMDCGILLIDPSHHHFNRLVRAGDYPVLTDTPLSLSGQGLVPEAIRTGQVVYAPDTHHDSRYMANVEQTRSELVIPLTTANGVIGVFDLQSPHLDGFSERDQRLLKAYAERAAAAIESKQLYAEVQHRAAELEWRVLQRTAELQQSQQKLQAIMDNTQAVIFVKDVNHRYMMVNRQFEKLFQVRQEQIVGKTDEDIFSPEDAKIFRSNDQAIISAGKPLQFEESVLQDDGLHTYMSYKVPLMDSNDQIYAICGISTDITNLKQMEAHLLESLEKERELHELKSQFVMMASHEFRTPLTIIQSSHEILFRYMERMDKPQRQKHFDEVRKQIAHMTGMLDDVLLIGQLDADIAETQQETGNLSDYIAEVVEDFRHIHTNHQIDYEHTHQILLVTGNTSLIRQILSNLLSNAIKYSNEQSCVLVSLQRAGRMAEIRVRDEGMGIPQADYDRVFEPFHRASNTGTIHGVGLGLAIVKRAIELMGGTITFESELGIGTTFTIQLPVNQNGVDNAELMGEIQAFS